MNKNDSTQPQTIDAGGGPIELSKLLKLAGLVGSGGEAKHVIREGMVLLNGAVEIRKGKKVVAGDRVSFGGQVLMVA